MSRRSPTVKNFPDVTYIVPAPGVTILSVTSTSGDVVRASADFWSVEGLEWPDDENDTGLVGGESA